MRYQYMGELYVSSASLASIAVRTDSHQPDDPFSELTYAVTKTCNSVLIITMILTSVTVCRLIDADVLSQSI